MSTSKRDKEERPSLEEPWKEFQRDGKQHKTWTTRDEPQQHLPMPRRGRSPDGCDLSPVNDRKAWDIYEDKERGKSGPSRLRNNEIEENLHPYLEAWVGVPDCQEGKYLYGHDKDNAAVPSSHLENHDSSEKESPAPNRRYDHCALNRNVNFSCKPNTRPEDGGKTANQLHERESGGIMTTCGRLQNHILKRVAHAPAPKNPPSSSSSCDNSLKIVFCAGGHENVCNTAKESACGTGRSYFKDEVGPITNHLPSRQHHDTTTSAGATEATSRPTADAVTTDMQSRSQEVAPQVSSRVSRLFDSFTMRRHPWRRHGKESDNIQSRTRGARCAVNHARHGNKPITINSSQEERVDSVVAPGAFHMFGRAQGNVPVWTSQWRDPPPPAENLVAPTLSTEETTERNNVVVASEVVPTEEDIEARVHARIQEETRDIAEIVQQRLIGGAVIADEVVAKEEQEEERIAVCSKTFPVIVATLSGILVVVIVVAVVLGVTLSGKDDSSDSSDYSNSSPDRPNVPTTLPPCNVPSVECKLKELYGGNSTYFEDEASPQSRTLIWLLEEDPAMLSADTPTFILQQRYATALMYFSTGGDTENSTWTDQFWFLSGMDVCDWHDVSGSSGVFCAAGSSAIDRIVLSRNGLQGAIPFELGILGLTELSLDGNRLRERIPSSLGLITSLKFLYLQENSLTGNIPESLFSLPRLSELFLYSNPGLDGQLPDSFVASGKLTVLDLDDCSFSGSIPESVGNLRLLQRFYASDNELGGTLPASLFQLPDLEVLNLLNNFLSGTIPEFGTMDKMYLLGLENNLLVGTIPPSIGSLPRVQLVSLAMNGLTGSIPSFSGNRDALSHLWLNENHLTGGITHFLASLPESTMTLLYLHENRLNGTIPDLIGNFPVMEEINFLGNQLSGTIPTQFGLLTLLDFQLNLQLNRLSGQIPSELGLLTLLQTLDLGANAGLTGTLPTELGRMTRLNFLQLYGSSVGGFLPEELENVRGLRRVGLHDNQFEGTVPRSLQSLDSLEVLWLHGNNLVGDLSPIFCTSQHDIEDFRADCLGIAPEVECDCCTRCCLDSPFSCEDI